MPQTGHSDSPEPQAGAAAAVPMPHVGFALREDFLRTSPVGAVFATQIHRASASAPALMVASLYAPYWKPARAGPRRLARLAWLPKKMGRFSTQGLAVSEGEEGKRGLRCLW